jgi:two-component system cell cycle response regulator
MSARILVVDDVPANAQLLEAKLNAEFYQVVTAQDGFEAIQRAHDWQPDVILLDVMMPGLDGFETCRRLKEDAATRHIPIVMVTALGEAAERVRGLDAGADDFLTKPVDYATLFVRLRSLVRLKRLLDEWRARGETARALGLSAEPEAELSVAGARALVVEDWEGAARAVEEALALDGITAVHAESEAISIPPGTAASFDLIVLSLSISSEHPLRLASRLRAADATHEVPLLLIAGQEQRDLIQRGFELGANDWLQRPLEPNELRARARNQIRRKFYQDRLRADVGQALAIAITDPLTGFYNKLYLNRHLSGLLASGQPNGLSVLMMDLDNFKPINDRFGHVAGDMALRAVADTVRGRTRAFDSIARYGGDEFVVIMPGTSLQDAASVAERLRESVAHTPFQPVSGESVTLTISIGVAAQATGTAGAEDLLRAADQALYRAKEAGRNCVALASGDLDQG